MKLQKWLENWDMTGLKIKTPFLEAEVEDLTQLEDLSCEA